MDSALDCEKARTTNSNHRIVPKIDDNGNISGAFFVLNTFYTEKPPLKLIEDKDKIMSHPSLKDDPKQAFWLQKKMGQ